MARMRALGLREAKVAGGFWAEKMELVAGGMLAYQWKALNDEIPGAEKSHAIENLRIAAGESEGEHQGNMWQDSDVAKWLEAASYVLTYREDAELASRVGEAARLFAAAQRPDGYLDSYFIVKEPDKRWQDLAWGHELYSAGHFIEAAVAHNVATGERSLLDVACRLADCVDRTFGEGEGKIRACCGHPEIELALYRLYRATGERRYRGLADFFLRERGRDPEAFAGKKALGFETRPSKWIMADYFQSHEPVSDQRSAEGHAVRAMYLYTALADEYAETGDPALGEALKSLWESVVSRRMYVTGGLGSQAFGERFTCDFDLPSDTAYAETCASIGFARWASRMSLIEGDSRYADAFERAAYNGILSGVSLDGTRYFYVNPLEVEPRTLACRQDHEHVKGARVEWFGCACCPPNIARLVASMPAYLYAASEDAIQVDHYAESEAEASLGGARVRLAQHTDYPWSGKVEIALEPEREAAFALRLRIPGWCSSWSCRVNGSPQPASRPSKGYLELRRSWRGGDRVLLELDMRPVLLRADPRIGELAGKLAVQRGPLVYCAEEADNGSALHALSIDPTAPLEEEAAPEFAPGCVRVAARGYRDAAGKGPEPGRTPYYPLGEVRAGREAARIVLVPYHLWGNRRPGQEMRVWLRSC